jgi:tetratricopeptide (TPR) repeat protein
MHNTPKVPALLLLLSLSILQGYAQNAAKQKANTAKANEAIYDANQLYQQRQYQPSLDKYNEALKAAPASYAGNYNAGNAQYQLGHYDTARKHFQQGLQSAPSKNEKAQSYHNIGNTYMQQKKWQEAVDAYKNSLRQNPADMETKYNLAYAQKMLKKQGGGGKNKDKNKKDQQQKQDKQQQNKNQQNKRDQQDQQQDQNQPEEQQPKQMQSNISKQQAEKILNALRQEEKKLQEDKKTKERGVPAKLDKDW